MITSKLTADSIKLDSYGYAMQTNCLAAVEVGLTYGICDMITMELTVNPLSGNVYEIEVKTRLDDFYKDFKNKAPKHYNYVNPLPEIGVGQVLIPDYLYYCVPEIFAEKVCNYFLERKLPYGVMIVLDRTYSYYGSNTLLHRVEVKKRAMRLTVKGEHKQRNYKILEKIARKLFRSYLFDKDLSRNDLEKDNEKQVNFVLE